MLEKYIGDMGLMAFILILAIIIIPIILGILLSMFAHATMITDYTITILFAIIVWMIIGLYFCK